MVVKEYSFELLRNYPNERRFLIKRQMSRSILDTIGQMLLGKR